MQKTFFVSFFILCTSLLTGQSIERKIIIQNGIYYFTTIDEENQLATLHTGKSSEALKDARKLAVPAGRNYDDPIVPFAWDVVDTSLYAVSFLVHPLNDRNEAIKRLLLSSLKEWDKSPTPMQLINLSVDMTPFLYNDPYLFMTKRSNLLEGFFYDLIATDNDAVTMVITNKGELSIWNYPNSDWMRTDLPKKWQHSDVLKFPVNAYFSLFQKDKKTYLITQACAVYEIKEGKLIPLKTDGMTNLNDGILIVNKDDNSVRFLKNSDLNQTTALSELIEKKGVNFLKNIK